ncbi:hypothetical protein [Thalassobaculum sp.]
MSGEKRLAGKTGFVIMISEVNVFATTLVSEPGPEPKLEPNAL